MIPHRGLADNFINDATSDVGQFLEAAGVQEVQPILIQSY
jgi:hypothetical protein